MKQLKFTGLIINRHKVRDADRFYTIYTKELGKISVYGRGVRTITSKRASQLELFSHIKFQVIESRGRYTLTSVELLSSHASSKTTLGNISRLFEIGELIDTLTPEHDPQLELYELFVAALASLARFETPEYMYRFKKKLLFILGYNNTEISETTIDSYIESLITRPLRAKINI